MFPEAADGNSTVNPGVKSLVKPVAGETKPAESPMPVIEVLAGLGATGGRPRSVSVEIRVLSAKARHRIRTKIPLHPQRAARAPR